MWNLTRRSWLHAAGLGSLAGSLLGSVRLSSQGGQSPHPQAHQPHAMGTVGRTAYKDFNPVHYLRSWNFSQLDAEVRDKYYRETPRPDGTLLREYDIFAVD